MSNEGSFQNVIGKGLELLPKKNEHHKPKGWREEIAIPQPGSDFQIDYVVEIGANRKNPGEEVTIEYDGLPHHDNNDRSGDKIRFPIRTGDITFTYQVHKDYDDYPAHHQPAKEGVEPGKDDYEPLQKGKMYGLRIVKRNVANTTVAVAYMQNLTDKGPLKEVMRVTDHGQFKGGKPRTHYIDGWRVGPRIDGKNDEHDPMYTKGIVVNKI